MVDFETTRFEQIAFQLMIFIFDTLFAAQGPITKGTNNVIVWVDYSVTAQANWFCRVWWASHNGKFFHDQITFFEVF